MHRVRSIRRSELNRGLEEEDFEFVISRSHPIAMDVLEDGIGFLTPSDCAGFDRAVHEYLNADYFTCAASGEEIIQRLVDLRLKRETDIYKKILETFHDVIEKVSKERHERYGAAVLTRIFRPWGRNRESVECWALSLHCLLRDDPPSVYYPIGMSLYICNTLLTLSCLSEHHSHYHHSPHPHRHHHHYHHYHH
jgi:hypothetical protein